MGQHPHMWVFTADEYEHHCACGAKKVIDAQGGYIIYNPDGSVVKVTPSDHIHYWFDFGHGQKGCYCGAILNGRERQFSDEQIATAQAICRHDNQQLFNDGVWRCQWCGKESGKGMLVRPWQSVDAVLNASEKQIGQQMLGHSLGGQPKSIRPTSIKLTPEAAAKFDLASSLERLFTFLARLNLQDHPVAEQREQVNLLHELGPKVRKLARFKKDGGVK